MPRPTGNISKCMYVISSHKVVKFEILGGKKSFLQLKLKYFKINILPVKSFDWWTETSGYMKFIILELYVSVTILQKSTFDHLNVL